VSPTRDPESVQQQYASDQNLSARQRLYEETTGPKAHDLLWEQLGSLSHRRVLEVGGGQGLLAQRIRDELEADVTFVDISPGMVALAAARGLDPQVGDVQRLPFDDGSFDLAVAAWMLYHVPDIDRGIGELARILRPGGALVAVTNSLRHLEELRRLIAYPDAHGEAFNAENGRELLSPHFAEVERHDAEATVTVRDRRRLVDYQQSLSIATRPVPDDVELPFVVHARSAIFVATR
jgi:SAM-dependent methyltransferase